MITFTPPGTERQSMPPVEYSVKSHDGVLLLSRRYEPVQPTRRSLVIVHGASEHGSRYDHVARLFADRGWRVIVSDNRGHGRSGIIYRVHEALNRVISRIHGNCRCFVSNLNI